MHCVLIWMLIKLVTLISIAVINVCDLNVFNSKTENVDSFACDFAALLFDVYCG